jgi:hypothetical protein
MKMKRDTMFGRDLMETLQEVRAHQRGEVALWTRMADAISAKNAKTDLTTQDKKIAADFVKAIKAERKQR